MSEQRAEALADQIEQLRQALTAETQRRSDEEVRHAQTLAMLVECAADRDAETQRRQEADGALDVANIRIAAFTFDLTAERTARRAAQRDHATARLTTRHVEQVLAAERTARQQAERERAAFQAAERELSDAYLRVRKLVGAWDTQHGGVDRFAVTEAKIADLRAQLTAAEQSRAALRTALEAAVRVAQDAYKAWNDDKDSRVGKLVMALAGHTRGYRADIDAIHATILDAALLAAQAPQTTTKDEPTG